MVAIKVKRQFIDVSDRQIHLRIAQPESAAVTAVPLICLHMVPKSGRGYARVMSELARNRIVLAPDYPGYGESDPLPEGHQPSIADYVESVYQVVEHFDYQQVDLLGYHTGSMVSVGLASAQPRLVRKLINISAPILTEQEVADFHQYYSPIPLDKEGTRFKTGWERVMYYAGPGMTLEMSATSFAENLRAGERYEDGHFAAFEYAQAYQKQLTALTQPILVMNLKDDLYEHCQRAEALIHRGRYKEYLNWGHGFLDIWPQEVAAEITDFLDSESEAVEHD